MEVNLRNATRQLVLVLAALGVVAAPGFVRLADAADDTTPRFNRDIRPILSEHCFKCHGFDPKQRKAGLRLDERAGATMKLESGEIAIVAGNADASELLRRLNHTDPDERMPPQDTGKVVSPEEITLLRQWIESGAEFEPHWAFVAPRKTNISEIVETEEPAAAIDGLIRARLRAQKLEPNPPAKPLPLFRRLSLDLTGLPPVPGDARAFAEQFATDPEGAITTAIDDLLESPHFGEKWARWWLDSAHYADSAGYSTDYERPHAWRYRDWVVNAFNRNQPFDRFTVEQIAGDLLPNSTVDQKIATGFFRHTLSNREGGADLQEFRVKKVKDRTRTLGATWLGLTVECAECHDHKFDPITQRDFYQLYAFFDNSDEININAPLQGEAEARTAKFDDYRKKRAALIDPIHDELEKLQAEWERRMLQAEANPGQDFKRDRALELLGILWGAGQGEGQLEGIRIVKTPLAERSEEQRQRLLEFFLDRGSLGLEEEFKRLKLAELKTALLEIDAELPKVSRPATLTPALISRETFVHVRGDFRAPGDAVNPGTPGALHKVGDNVLASTRLDLAQWIVAGENPLTARVIVNRIWEQLFGSGIVETTDDFGAQGRAPSHPELLDWLAVDFVESGWNLKLLLHTILSSKTYQQSCDVRTELAEHDPGNLLLGRHPRLRLSAELIRDSALAVSGLLDPKLGGPSVFPPQPESVSAEGSYGNKWKLSEGGDRYRRGVYTFLQRISPYAQFQTFDLPNVNRTCTRRGRSNTPLQALTLLNDPVFVEAAGALSKRMTEGKESEPEQIIRRGFWLSLSRVAEPREVQRLETFRQQQVQLFENEKAANPEESAWAATASVLLNLDEFITKE